MSLRKKYGFVKSAFARPKLGARASSRRLGYGVAIKRAWCVPDKAKMRYGGLRGVYWYWLSRDIRKSEWEKWGKKCITCEEEIEDWQYADCGHMIASQGCGEFLRFNRINLTIQHKKCNNPRFTPNMSALNAIHYDERHGKGAWLAMWKLRKVRAKEPTADQYRELIQALPSYQEAYAALQMR